MPTLHVRRPHPQAQEHRPRAVVERDDHRVEHDLVQGEHLGVLRGVLVAVEVLVDLGGQLRDLVRRPGGQRRQGDRVLHVHRGLALRETGAAGEPARAGDGGQALPGLEAAGVLTAQVEPADGVLGGELLDVGAHDVLVERVELPGLQHLDLACVGGVDEVRVRTGETAVVEERLELAVDGRGTHEVGVVAPLEILDGLDAAVLPDEHAVVAARRPHLTDGLRAPRRRTELVVALEGVVVLVAGAGEVGGPVDQRGHAAHAGGGGHEAHLAAVDLREGVRHRREVVVRAGAHAVGGPHALLGAVRGGTRRQGAEARERAGAAEEAAARQGHRGSNRWGTSTGVGRA